MPWSETARRPWVLQQLRARAGLPSIRSVVDVGAGAGTWHTFLSPSLPNAVWWTAVEIWEPYVQRFRMAERYDEVIVSDARALSPLPEADLYLFGDVLEHMSPLDAVQLWNRAREAASWLVLSIPVLPCPQGPVEGNIHEIHQADWDLAGVLESFPGIVAYTGPPAVPPGAVAGAFIAEGLA